MRIAVIGGGTAGFMAAAAVTRFRPNDELIHIYDPDMPAIGVGEGTLAKFPPWLESVTGLPESEWIERGGATRKYAIRFEGWGGGVPFRHHLYPVGEGYGYHIHAPAIIDILREHVRARVVPRRVRSAESDGRGVRLEFEDGDPLDVDFLFDARGFPPPDAPGTIELPGVTTDAAFVRGASPLAGQDVTRAVARPHGWVFVIPLRFRRSYGYVFNGDISSADEVEADLAALMREDGAEPIGDGRLLRFPSFTRTEPFDGAHFIIGNAASFVEPLEATAIGIVQTQVEMALRWPLGAWRLAPPTDRRRAVDAINRFHRRYLLRTALFLSWHYGRGSVHETAFWRQARLAAERARTAFPDPELLAEFERFRAASEPFDEPAAHDRFLAEAAAGAPLSDPQVHTGRFGLWPLNSFIEVGTGLDGRRVASAAT